MKKKTKIIIFSIVAAVLILGFVIWVIMPRVALSKMVDEFLIPNFSGKGDFFDGYDVRNDSFKRVENEFVSLDIPSGFILETQPSPEHDYPYIIYRRNDTNEVVLLMSEPYDAVMDLTDYSQYDENENVPDEKAFKKLMAAFESFGYGLPDSRFAVYKCSILLDKEDYSFWNMGKATAFVVLGTIKATGVSLYEECYVYESENIKGILSIEENTVDEDHPTRYEAAFEVYPVSDLNHSYTIMFGMNSLDDIYAVMNSVELK